MTVLPEKAATGGASSRPNMEPARLLYDDGNPALCRSGAKKTEESQWVDGWTATSLDGASRMEQESRGSDSTWFCEIGKKRFEPLD